jgi:hypothetical protein
MKELMRVTNSGGASCGEYVVLKNEHNGLVVLRPRAKWTCDAEMQVSYQEEAIDDQVFVDLVDTLMENGRDDLAWHVIGIRIDDGFLITRPAARKGK